MTGAPATVSLSAQQVRDAIRSARAQHRAGGEAVVDILARALPAKTDLAAELRRHGGVELLGTSDGCTADYAVWDRESARTHRCVLLRSHDGQLVAAAEDPWDETLIQRVAALVATQPAPAATTRALIQHWLGEAVADGAVGQSSTGSSFKPSVSGAIADGPVVAFVDQALMAGFTGGASDVHFECDGSSVTVKHRLDGVMVSYSRMDSPAASQEVISRIKVLAKLDITERRLPQDGRFRLDVNGGPVDLRVSIMPSVHGEDAVLRILDKAQLRGRDKAVTLSRLGFDVQAAAEIRMLAELPSGMLLVTGPTGSGKTTTVYAALAEINTGLEKIITIEDPVEYELPGVLQIPVNERKGLTFAKGLRSILRHDPDRILVGEIRDAETAEIAIQSALTGHLVFTTVHANNVSDIVGRFRHFHLDMFGFMSALNGVIVQRLLRRLCTACARSRAPLEQERRWLENYGLSEVAEIPAPGGCSVCHGTGYKGRFVVAEVHRVDDALRDHITGGAPLSIVKAHAARSGVSPLAGQGLAHAVARLTSIEEVRRVVGL